MPERKTIIITVTSVAVVALIVLGVLMVGQRGEEAPEQKPLLYADEVKLQEQTDKIISTGTEADCATIANSRYQFICNNYFESNISATTSASEKMKTISSQKEFKQLFPNVTLQPGVLEHLKP